MSCGISTPTKPAGRTTFVVDFAGYSTVTTTHGTSGGPTSVTKTLYYRGMDSDRTGTGDYTRPAGTQRLQRGYSPRPLLR